MSKLHHRKIILCLSVLFFSHGLFASEKNSCEGIEGHWQGGFEKPYAHCSWAADVFISNNADSILMQTHFVSKNRSMCREQQLTLQGMCKNGHIVMDAPLKMEGDIQDSHIHLHPLDGDFWLDKQ